MSLRSASMCFSVRSLGPLWRRFVSLFTEDFSACATSGSAPAVSGSRQGVRRGCAPSSDLIVCPLFPSFKLAGPRCHPPVIWGIRLGRRFRSSLYPLPGPQSPLSDQGLTSASFRGLSGDRIYVRSRFNYVNCTAIIVSSALTAHTS